MDSIGKVGFLVIVVCVTFNLIVTMAVVREVGLQTIQKILQTILVWVLPVIGGSIVLAMQGQNHTRDEMKKLVPFPFYLVGYRKPYRDSGPKFGEG